MTQFRFSLRTLFLFFLGLGIGVPALLWLISTRGACIYFSPDTLTSKSHRERLLYVVQVPVYYGPSRNFQHDLPRYLVENGYWTPTETNNPRWIGVHHWNRQWRSDGSYLYRQIVSRGDNWIRWTEANPEFAAELWPLVLQILRDNDPNVADYIAAQVLYVATISKNLDEFREELVPIACSPDVPSPTLKRYLQSHRPELAEQSESITPPPPIP